MDLRRTIGLNVRYHRARLGLTCRAFCLKAGVAQWTLCRIEHGKSSARVDTLEIIAMALGVKVVSLFREMKS